jgi:AcrR family transcriptional regulator
MGVVRAERRRGRPRDPAVDAAIHRAVLDMLVEVGYAELTIEAVAKRAGVGHTSIYRRWPSKAHMVHEVVFPDERGGSVQPGTPFVEMVRQFATGAVESLSRPEARAAIPGLMADWQADPVLRRRLMDRFEPATRARLSHAAAEAVARGELRAEADVDRVYDAILGTAVAAQWVSHGALGQRLVDTLVDLVLNGVLARPAGDPADSPAHGPAHGPEDSPAHGPEDSPAHGLEDSSAHGPVDGPEEE